MESTDILETFGNRLSNVIGESGSSAKQIYTACEMSPSSLLNYRKGLRDCGIKNLAALARYLHVSPDYLLGFSDSPNSEIQKQQPIYYAGLSEVSIKNLSAIIDDDNTPEDAISNADALDSIMSNEGFPRFIKAYAAYLTLARKSYSTKAEHNVEAYFLGDERVSSNVLDDILGNGTNPNELTDSVAKQKQALKEASSQLYQILLEEGRKLGEGTYNETYESLRDEIESKIAQEENLRTADWDDLE